MGNKMRSRSPSPSQSSNRNVSNLPPFWLLAPPDRVPIPEELLNEPYTYDDNGLRPEIRQVGRSKFRFEIADSGTPTCIVGRQLITRVESPRRRYHAMPSKRRTSVSVINVYDAYGLDIARRIDSDQSLFGTCTTTSTTLSSGYG